MSFLRIKHPGLSRSEIVSRLNMICGLSMTQWGFLALLGDFGYSQNGGGTFSDFLIFFSPWLYLLITTSSSLKAAD